MHRIALIRGHLDLSGAYGGRSALEKEDERLAVVVELNDDHDDGRLLVLSVTNASAVKKVRIGDVSYAAPPPPRELAHQVPVRYMSVANESQEILKQLKFLLQKDLLNQDVYLIGPPGPLRRRIAKKYCELVRRPLEYVSLSQDTTEADLKQRREISSGTARYVDCAATRAAINGSILVLDGVEKAERNVLVVLNNLLENREMSLEDGRFLVSPKRFDNLLSTHTKEEMEAFKLVRCSDRFRVIALGLPIPRYPGSTLDPPFRSRFQARDVQSPPLSHQITQLEAATREAGASTAAIRSLLQCAAVLREMRESESPTASSTSLPEFPQGFEEFTAKALTLVPFLDARQISDFVFPFLDVVCDGDPRTGGSPGDERIFVVRKVFRRFGMDFDNNNGEKKDGLGEVEETTRISLASQPRAVSMSLEALSSPPPRLPHKRGGHGATTTRMGKMMLEFELESSPLVDAGENNGRGVTTTTASIMRTEKIEVPVMYGNHAPYLHHRRNRQQQHPAQEEPESPGGGYVETATTERALAQMLFLHACGSDICLVGEKGGGKSKLVQHFARLLDYAVEHIPLYKDVSARQLLQRRSTRDNGDTVWEDSPLVTAALSGSLAVLDGAEQMVPSTLASLQDLLCDREVRLPDERTLLARPRFEAVMRRDGLDEAEMRARGMEPIHECFRVVAVARPANVDGARGSATAAKGAWLTSEIQTMFRFVYLRAMPPAEQAEVLREVSPLTRESHVEALNRLSVALREAVKKDDMLSALESTVSLRQLVRICRRLAAEEAERAERGERTGQEEEDASEGALHRLVLAAALDRFLPPMAHEALVKVLEACGIKPSSSTSPRQTQNDDDENAWRITVDERDVLHVGNRRAIQLSPPRDPLLVPQIVFYDNPRQTRILQDMLLDFAAGQHLLLIGNQGVGKNKLIDRMLQLLRLPREYIQLHRDTTVQNLTSNPTIVSGRLLYEDSPLVKAAREGRVLVVDEADKAPTYVTAILKALVEDRSMLLSDGRRIVDEEEARTLAEAGGAGVTSGEIIVLHPEFRVVALANRPGFPFHGNDFFREVGDVFACHAIDNPDADSELYLMREYGPDVPTETLRRLVAAFDELRTLSDQGRLSYPYSTRELAAVVKHMQRFPKDGVDRIIRNVFDFDNYFEEEKAVLVQTFAKHGIPFAMGNAAFAVRTGATRDLGPPRLAQVWTRAVAPAGPQGSASSFSLPSEVFSLEAIARVNHGNGTWVWSMRPPEVMASLNKRERAAAYFSEERYSFKLPRSSIVGATGLPDGRLVCAARSGSFLLHVVDPAHSTCNTYDIFAALPADGAYRVAPRLASLAALPSNANKMGWDLLLSHQDAGNLMGIDLSNNRLTYFDKLPNLVRGSKLLLVCAPQSHLVAYFQKSESHFAVIDTVEGTLHAARELPMKLASVEPLGKFSWLLTSKEDECYVITLEKEATTTTMRSQFRVFLVKRSAAFVPSAVAARSPPPAPALLPLATAAEASLSPGALPRGSARYLLLSDSSRSHAEAGFAVGLPEAMDRGKRGFIYTLDGTENRTETGKDTVCGLHLVRSDLFAVARELREAFRVDVEVFDAKAGKSRTLEVSLEDDAITEAGKMPAGAVKAAINSATLNLLTPFDLQSFGMRRGAIADTAQRLFLVEGDDGHSLITVDCMGWVRTWFVTEDSVRRAFAVWRDAVGHAESVGDLKLSVEGENGEGEGENEGEGSGRGKGKGTGEGEGEGEGNGKGKGKGDGEGEGEGNGKGSGPVSQGGGGGTGGARGKKRLEDVSELPDPGQFVGREIPNPAQAFTPRLAGGENGMDAATREEARIMKREEFERALKRIGMSEFDAIKYGKYRDAVSSEIRELRGVLEGLNSKDQERVWGKNQTVGDLDDQKLIDGLTGDRAVYKRRKDVDPNDPFFQPKQKKLSFVFDASMSMSRYASDGRLERSLEAAVMVMESLRNFERKFDYRIVGHSGDTDELVLKKWGDPLATEKARMDVVKALHAHAEMCDSGDNTLEACRKAVFDVAALPDADDRFVFLLSDANLQQYSITPEMLARLFELDKRVHVFVIFIASLRDSATAFAEKYPQHVYVCLDKRDLPKVLKRMFLSAATR